MADAPFAQMQSSVDGTQSPLNADGIPPLDAKGEIRLRYPESATAPLSYKLNDTDFSMKPGQSIVLAPSAKWELEFPAGGNFGQRAATLEADKDYYFENTEDEGWVLMLDQPEAAESNQSANPETQQDEAPAADPFEQEPKLGLPAVTPPAGTDDSKSVLKSTG